MRQPHAAELGLDAEHFGEEQLDVGVADDAVPELVGLRLAYGVCEADAGVDEDVLRVGRRRDQERRNNGGADEEAKDRHDALRG